ncbi:MAG: hypothetical protein ACR2HR_05075 [Euzebya sp.]
MRVVISVVAALTMLLTALAVPAVAQANVVAPPTFDYAAHP